MDYVYNLEYIMWGGEEKKTQQNPQKFPNTKPL